MSTDVDDADLVIVVAACIRAGDRRLD